MHNQFDKEYIDALENFQGDLDTPIDPREAFSSIEICLPPVDTSFANGHYSSGIFYSFHVSPTSFDLDPYFFFADGERLEDPKYVTDFRCVINNGPDSSAVSAETNLQLMKQMPTSVRPACLRGPLLLSGWGYDTNGLPVPIERGGVDANGNPVPEDEENPDSRNFNFYTPIERRLWKTGPIDLRWDNQRKVWVGGAEFVEGVMYTSLTAGDPFSPTIGSGQIYRGPNWKFEGYTLTGNLDGSIKPEPYGSPQNFSIGDKLELVRIYNRNPGLSLAAGDYFAATKINDEWRIVGAGGGGGNCIVGKFKRINCTSTGVQKSSFTNPTIYEQSNKVYLDFGTLVDKYVYYLVTQSPVTLIPTEAAGGQLVPSNGKLEIPAIGLLPYYISLISFENCKYSSDVVQIEVITLNNAPFYNQISQKPVNSLYDCPDSQECFGTVTDDITGQQVFAVHPFKFVKHNVRVIACGSNQTINCQGETYSAYLITEVDECANSGTGDARE